MAYILNYFLEELYILVLFFMITPILNHNNKRLILEKSLTQKGKYL